jgi:glycosyltransferase involved in cell wall biosynthesis
MRLLVSIQTRFLAHEGGVYSHHLTYERFWKRYLAAFEEVLVIGRVAAGEPPAGWGRADGPNVTFHPLPDYVGPVQYLLRRGRIVAAVRRAVRQCRAYILRLPCAIGTLLWKQLPPRAPFGVEVVGDPYDGFSRLGISSSLRAYYRWSWTRNLRLQCASASASAYVTREALQRRYPPAPGAFTTHYSSVELPVEALVGDLGPRLARIEALADRMHGRGEPVRIGFIGSFSQRHKLPDLHIRAVAECIEQGRNLELEMIGDGSRLEEMKHLAAALGVDRRVRFRGRIPGGEPVLRAIDAMDLLVNASAVEGLPRVVIEAMARACPAIGSTVGGIPELLGPRWLVRAGDVPQLAAKICEVLDDAAALEAAARRNVAEARNYCRDVLEPRRREMYGVVRDQAEAYSPEKRR